ncbi:MAG: hypothetical protein ACK5DD_16180, partial [Cyclobacteriaceae bacterium]
MIKPFLFFSILSVSGVVSAQQTRGQAAVFNVATGSLVSGLGALINKKPGERPLRVFFAGMARGACGGALVYASKEMVYCKISDRDTVLLLPSAISQLLEIKPNDIRDRHLVQFERDI